MSSTARFSLGERVAKRKVAKSAKSCCSLCKYYQESSSLGTGSGQKSDAKDFSELSDNYCGMCLLLRDAIVAAVPSARDHLGNLYLTLSWAHTEVNNFNIMSPLKVTGIGGPFAGDVDDDSDYSEHEDSGLSEDDEHIRFELELYTLKGKPSPWPSIGCSNTVPGDTSSAVSFAQVQEWLRDCTANHTCKVQPKSSLPYRILELSVGDASHTPFIRLVEEPNLSARYACLSYCWGSSHNLKTTRLTIEAHKSQIAWSVLPHTFKDAINYALKLGINYLWIDSLCIIQDDLDDWRKQSAQMSSIYEHCYITLAATASRDSDGGLTPSATMHPSYHPLELHGSGPDGEYHIGVRKYIPHWYENGEDYRYWGRVVDLSKDFPLLTRAWVFQERLLSPRVLHFGQRELLWECKAAVFCECSGVEFDPPLIQSKINHRPGTWRSMVHEFSRLNMTFDKDVFPALSGAVRQIQRIRSAEYIAGLWKDDLVEDLIWETYNPWAGRPTAWRAPTWSWASIKGAVDYNYSSNTVTYCTPMSVSRSLAGTDPSGELESAKLLIEGQLTAGSLQYDPASIAAKRSAAQYRSNTATSTDTSRSLSNFAVTYSKFTSYKWYFYADYDLSAEGDGYMSAGDTAFFLRMAYKGYQHVYLVLKTSSSTSGAYERIGIGRYIKNLESISLGGSSYESTHVWEGAQSVPLRQSDREGNITFIQNLTDPETGGGWFSDAKKQIIAII